MRYVVRSVDERGKKEAKEYLAIFAANEVKQGKKTYFKHLKLHFSLL